MNIGMEDGVHDGGLWGCDDLVESVRKHDRHVSESTNEMD